MEQETSIQIEKKTRERMQKYRLAKRESYDEIINRLLDKEDESRKRLQNRTPAKQ